MKYSNIAKLCDDLGIKVLTKIGRLDNYSKQNKEEFLKIFEMVSSESVFQKSKYIKLIYLV